MGAFEVKDQDSSDSRGNGLLNVTIACLSGELSLSAALPRLSILPVFEFVIRSASSRHDWMSRVSFLATETDVNTALRVLQYRAASRFVGVDIVSLAVSDNENWGPGGVLSTSASISIDVLPSPADGTVWNVTGMPIRGGAYHLVLTEDTAFLLGDMAPVVLIGADVDVREAGVDVSFKADHSNFNLNVILPDQVYVSLGVHSIDIKGSVADVNLLLPQVQVFPDENYSGHDNLRCNLYEGIELSARLSVDLDVLSVNDAPFWIPSVSGTAGYKMRGFEGTPFTLEGIGYHVRDVDIEETLGSVLELNMTARYGSLGLQDEIAAVVPGVSMHSHSKQSLQLFATSVEVLNRAMDEGMMRIIPPSGWSGTEELELVVSDLGFSPWRGQNVRHPKSIIGIRTS